MVVTSKTAIFCSNQYFEVQNNEKKKYTKNESTHSADDGKQAIAHAL